MTLSSNIEWPQKKRKAQSFSQNTCVGVEIYQTTKADVGEKGVMKNWKMYMIVTKISASETTVSSLDCKPPYKGTAEGEVEAEAECKAECESKCEGEGEGASGGDASDSSDVATWKVCS